MTADVARILRDCAVWDSFLARDLLECRGMSPQPAAPPIFVVCPACHSQDAILAFSLWPMQRFVCPACQHIWDEWNDLTQCRADHGNSPES
jgi:hypothetical protein